ncbi:MAG: hypothetical protein R3F49_16330 [Planctomycetota bacterium]
MMFSNDTTELDAIILVGDDPATAERCLAALVAASIDVPLRTWVIEAAADIDGAAALHHRCVWTRSVDPIGNTSARINRALAQGHAPLVLVIDGSHDLDADSVRSLVQHLRDHTQVVAAGLGVLPAFAETLRPGTVGPAFIVRREALQDVGAFDERSFAGMQAEAEAWCRRAERSGAEVCLSHRSKLKLVPSTQRLVLSKPIDDPLLERRAFRGRFASPGLGHTMATRPDYDAWSSSLRGTLIERVNAAFS